MRVVTREKAHVQSDDANIHGPMDSADAPRPKNSGRMLLIGVVVDTVRRGGSDAKAMPWLASSKSLVSAFSCGEMDPIKWTTEKCKGGCATEGVRRLYARGWVYIVSREVERPHSQQRPAVHSDLTKDGPSLMDSDS